jgi:threonine dehydrogenase-like Zn-dependent dehydrogenase
VPSRARALVAEDAGGLESGLASWSDPSVLALWLEDRRLRLRDDCPRPEPPPGEALVRVLRAGVCNTDLELVKGYYSYAGIPGHEFVGRVEAAAGAEAWVGRRVVGEINATCGECPTCRAGRPAHCERRTVLGIVKRGGAFAEYLLLPVANLHEVPAGVPDEVAVFTEPTAAALEVQEQVPVGPGQRVIVVGSGKLGSLVAQTLALSGCDLLVVGRNPATIGALAARGLRTGSPAELPERRADLVVECTGNPDGLTLALRAVRPRGTVVLKSTYHGPATLDLARLVVDEVTLVGSRCGPFAPALALLASGRVDVRPLVAARYPLRQAITAFEHAARPGTLKVLVEC